MANSEHDQWVSDATLRQALHDAGTYCIPRYVCNAYRDQYLAARDRGIAFRFSLPEWRRWWWERLGRAERGRLRSGVRMGLIDPAGAFEAGNVCVVAMPAIPKLSASEAHKQAWARRKASGDHGHLAGKSGDAHPRSRAVVTAEGVRFGSISEAARAAGVTRATGFERVRRGVWRYAP